MQKSVSPAHSTENNPGTDISVPQRFLAMMTDHLDSMRDPTAFVQEALFQGARILGCPEKIEPLIQGLRSGNFSECGELLERAALRLPVGKGATDVDALTMGRLVCASMESAPPSTMKTSASASLKQNAPASLCQSVLELIEFLHEHKLRYYDVPAAKISDRESPHYDWLISQLRHNDLGCRIPLVNLRYNRPGLGVLNVSSEEDRNSFLQSPGAQVTLLGGKNQLFAQYFYHLGGHYAPEDVDIIPPSIEALKLNLQTTAVAFHASVRREARRSDVLDSPFGDKPAPAGGLYRILSCLTVFEAFLCGCDTFLGYVRVAPARNKAIGAHHRAGWMDAIVDGQPYQITLKGHEVTENQIRAARDHDAQEALIRKSFYKDQTLQILTMPILDTLVSDRYWPVLLAIFTLRDQFPFFDLDSRKVNNRRSYDEIAEMLVKAEAADLADPVWRREFLKSLRNEGAQSPTAA